MSIIDRKLEFAGTLKVKDTDPYSAMLTKIILCRTDAANVDIEKMHEQAKAEGKSGIPYQYVVMKNGTIYYCRSRAYENGLELPHINFLRNAIAILIEGKKEENYPALQKQAIIDLCSMIIVQDNICPEDIMSEYEILTGSSEGEKRSEIISAVIDKVSEYDPYRSIIPTSGWDKIVTSNSFKNIKTIMIYAGIPQTQDNIDIIYDMNKGISDMDNIPLGTTVFLPSNRMTDFKRQVQICLNANYLFEHIMQTCDEKLAALN